MSENHPGKRDEANVPDTLDLTERARLALHGIASTVDPDDEYNMWFEVFWCANPPYMLHSGCDVECAPKFVDALHQLRIASGSEEHRQVEDQALKYALGYLDPSDGLYYARHEPEKRPWKMGGYKGASVKAEDYALPNSSGILLTALVPRYELGLDCEAQIRGIVEGLEKISVSKDDYSYYPLGASGHPFSRPRSGWGNTDEPADEHEGGEGAVTAYFGYPIRGLAMWAAACGDSKALDLAGRFARFVMKRKFWGHPKSDPPMVAGNEIGHVDSHFHARSIALRGLLEYGIVAGDPHVIDFVRTAYEQMRHYGIHEIGFHPCWPNHGKTAMEGCFLGDLVALTVRMSEAGVADCWEDADRVIRNHLAEAQYIRRNYLERVSSAAEPRQARYVDGVQQFTDEAKTYPGQRCDDRVLDRAVGLFASYLVPDFSAGRIMQCCTANAARGIYYAWESITRQRGEDAEVNLLLNRAAPWLDVESHLPYEGRAVIRNKTARRIDVRIPAWVSRKDLECAVNGRPYAAQIAGHRAVFGDLKPGDAIELRFPVREWRIVRTAHARTPEETVYTIAFRGNTVVDISPRNGSPTVYPMYERDHMKEPGTVPVKKVARNLYKDVPRW